MKGLLTVFAALALSGLVWADAVSHGLQVREGDFDGTVTWVTDGDSIRVQTEDGAKVSVRLYGIDAPERDQPFGSEASLHLRRLVRGRTVRVVCRNRDTYGRLVATVLLGKMDVSLKMLSDGCAWHYSYYDATPAYAEAERHARAEGRGLWAEENPINPYAWRKERKEKKRSGL